MQQLRAVKTPTSPQPNNAASQVTVMSNGKTQNNEQTKHAEHPEEGQVSALPLESYRRSSSRGKKIGSQVKYMHLNKSKSPMSPNHSRLRVAKNVCFRAKTHYVSEEKARNKLQETLMLERERRFNKLEIQKKNQRLVSPHLIKDNHMKKFARTEEKRLLAEKKKFKRIKEKPNEHEIAVREKLMKKFVENARNQLSGIAEISEDPNISQIQVGTRIPAINETFSILQSQMISQEKSSQ